MTEIMSNEAFGSQESDETAEIRAITAEILTIVPQASDTKRLSKVEARISEEIMIILANRQNDDPADADFIVSQIKSAPGMPLERETFRWSSTFPGSRDLQVHETILPDRVTNKPAPSVRKGFDQDDLEKIRDLVVTAGEHERK